MFDVFCLVVYDVNLTIKSCQKEGAHKTSMNNDLQQTGQVYLVLRYNQGDTYLSWQASFPPLSSPGCVEA